MVQLSGWVVIAIIQIIFVLAGSTAYFLYRASYYKKIGIHLKNRLKPFLQAKDSSKGAASRTENLPADKEKISNDKGLLEELRRLREQISTSDLRIKNLEKFRGLYFQVKASIESISEIQDVISTSINATNMPEEVIKKVREAFERLNQEKRSLEDHIKQAQEQLDLLLAGEPPNVETSSESSRSIIFQQKTEIARLSQLIAELEIEASSTRSLSESLSSLTKRSDELGITVEVLQEENQFLQDQIRALLQQDNDSEKKLKENMSALEQRLVAREAEYNDLHLKHAQLETEYLKIQEKPKR